MMQYQSNFRCRNRFWVRLALVGLVFPAAMVRAQPNSRGDGRGAGATLDNAQNNDGDLPPREDAEEAREPAQDSANRGAARITPFQNKPRREVELRNLMATFGIGDTATQDAVLNHIGDQVRARALLRRKTAALLDALKRADGSDSQVRVLLEEYRNAADSDKDRRREAEETLNDRIGFKNNPRLEAVLVLFGVLGDNPILVPFGSRPFAARQGFEGNSNQRPKGTSQGDGPVDVAPGSTRPDALDGDGERIRNRRAEAPREEKSNESVLLGTVMSRRTDGIDVKADDGVIHRFLARRIIDKQGRSGLDRVMLQAFAQLNPGDRVRLKWAQTDRKRIMVLERIDSDR